MPVWNGVLAFVAFLGFITADRGCLGLSTGLYVYPYKDRILGRISVCSGSAVAGFRAFRGSFRSGRTRQPSSRAGQCSQSRQQRGVTYPQGMIVHIYMHVRMSTWFAHACARAHVWLSLLIGRARACLSFVAALVFSASGARGRRSHHSCYSMLGMACYG